MTPFTGNLVKCLDEGGLFCFVFCNESTVAYIPNLLEDKNSETFWDSSIQFSANLCPSQMPTALNQFAFLSFTGCHFPVI